MNMLTKFEVSSLCRSRDIFGFKFGVHFDHSNYQPTDNKLSLKGALVTSRD